MRNSAEKIDPEDYILAVLTPKERLDTALKVAAQAFKGSKLTKPPLEGGGLILTLKGSIYLSQSTQGFAESI